MCITKILEILAIFLVLSVFKGGLMQILNKLKIKLILNNYTKCLNFMDKTVLILNSITLKNPLSLKKNISV